MRTLVMTSMVFLIACTNREAHSPSGHTHTLSAGMEAYISSHTSPNIDVDSQLEFRFSGSMTDADHIGTEVDPALFKIKPKVSGRAYWRDMSTLVFAPDEPLDFDSQYDVEISLNELFPEIEESLSLARLSFRTNPFTLEVNLHNLEYLTHNETKQVTLSGTVRSQNGMDEATLESFFSFEQKGNDNLQVTWEHQNKRRRTFRINNINRSEVESQVEVIWDATRFNKDDKGKLSMVVLPYGLFQIIDASISQEQANSCIIHFSDQLDRSQDLTGLITIKDYDDKLKLDIVGSKVMVTPTSTVPSPFTIKVSQHVKRANGDKLEEDSQLQLAYSPLKPSVSIIGKGVIIPDEDEIIFPFTATNLKTATVEIYKVHQSNVLQYLQYGDLDQNGNRHTVGKVIHRQKIKLNDYTETTGTESKRIALDIKEFILPDPGSIYQVRVGFDQSDVINYECPSDNQETFVLKLEEEESMLDRYGYYDWRERDNPCHRAYFTKNRYINRNILASHLGIIAKYGKDKQLTIAVSDLNTAAPIRNVNLTIYDYQKQQIGQTVTNSTGLTQITIEDRPGFIIAKHKGAYGYLNLYDNRANSLSEFDVSGKTKKKGLDGMIYGERGVWRPGDTLHLDFMLEDKTGRLPSDHPISFEVVDSRSNQVFSETTSRNMGQIYSFSIPTQPSAPTGNWRAKATVGNQVFTQTLKVETIKPNRLKISFDPPDKNLKLFEDSTIPLSSEWLHGAPATGLQAKVDLKFSAIPTEFSSYKSYIFDCLLYTSPSPRDQRGSRMPSSA